MNDTFVRPALSAKGQTTVTESLTSFKKRNPVYQIWMVGRMMVEFQKLVAEVNNQRLAREIPVISTESEFSNTCKEIKDAIDARELVKAARLIMTENTRMIEECNQHRQVQGVRSKLARSSAGG